jgi:Bacterial nucleoid DNA-binding protein
MAKNADLNKAQAGRALDALVDAVRRTLKKGDSVSLIGFGTFAVTKRAARTGRNPVPAPPSRSRPPRFRSSVRARVLKTPSSNLFRWQRGAIPTLLLPLRQ